MASRSSSSTRSQRTGLAKPSERSRAELPSQGSRSGDGGRASASAQRSPKDKKHKNIAEVQSTGRQSDQGGRPGSGKRSSGRS
jgi:hypothetical protein